MISMTCPTCREKIRIAMPGADRAVKCPVCEATFILPAEAPPPLPTAQQPRKVVPVPSQTRGPRLSRHSKAGWRRRIVLLTLGAIGVGLLLWWNRRDGTNPNSSFIHDIAARFGWSKPSAANMPLSAQGGHGVVVRVDTIGQGSSGAATHPSAPTSPNGRFLRDRVGLSIYVKAQYPDQRDQIVAVSKQGQRVAVKRVVDGGRTVVVAADEPIGSGASTAGSGGVAPRYAGQALFTPDGKHLAWLADIGGGDRQVVVIDGKVGQEFARIRAVAFNADSDCFTFIAQKTDKSWRGMIILNGIEQEMAGFVSPGATSIPATSVAEVNNSVARRSDGAHQARIFPTTRPDDNTSVVEVDGVKDHPVIGKVTDLQFSPNGLHYVYLVHVPGNGEQVSVFADGINLKNPLFGQCYGLGFVSPDRLQVVLGAPDGTLRLMELRLVPSSGVGRPPASQAKGTGRPLGAPILKMPDHSIVPPVPSPAESSPKDRR